MWVKENWFQLSIVLILVIALLMGAHYVISIKPEQDRALAELQRESIDTIEQIRAESSASTEETKLKLEAALQEAAAARSEAQRANAVAAQASLATYISENNTSLADVVREWSPVIPVIVCYHYDGSLGGGSGTVIGFSDGPSLVTNRHVVTKASAWGDITADSCAAYFPDYGETITWTTEDILLLSNGYDMAFMSMPSWSYAAKEAKSNRCLSAPQIGDGVVMLGFPGAGASQSITATDGIISGFENEYYVTSAKINPGNSGGAAIDVERNCYLGIPTAVNLGGYEGLARILRSDAWYWTPHTGTTQVISFPGGAIDNGGGSGSSGGSSGYQKSDKEIGEEYYRAHGTCDGLQGTPSYTYCVSHAWNN